MKKEKEKKIILLMISIHCKSKHKTRDNLCPKCQELLDYCIVRIEKCPYKAEDKPFCSSCPFHCYKGEMQTRIVNVMRRVRFRMFLKHPILSINHLIETFKQKRKEK